MKYQCLSTYKRLHAITMMSLLKVPCSSLFSTKVSSPYNDWEYYVAHFC